MPPSAAFASLVHDFRYAFRSLRKSPGFLAVVVVSLALGIAANSTMFSVLNAELYRPLPYDHPDRLMVIWQVEEGKPDSEQGPAIAEVVDWNKQSQAFEEIALTSGTETAPLSQLGEPELIRVQYSTPNFFHVLRVKPALGRIFAASEMQDRSQSVLISDSFWQQRFQRNPDALGKSFNIAGVESTVVGIMPPNFSPFHDGRIDVWQPIDPASARYSARKDGGWLMPVGRLKPGVTRAEAQTEMNLIARRMAKAYPVVDKGLNDRVIPLQEAVSGWARMLYPLLGAVAFVLLIACLNVANLLQSRSETRRKEKAVRASLGASRGRLIQQLLAESSLLALFGGALGLCLSYAGIKLLLFLANGFPNAEAIRIDLRVVLFTLAVSLLTALLFGIAPALQFSRPDLNSVIREGDTRTVAGSRRRLRRVLVVAEVALAMVLLVGAGLMIKTVLRMQHAYPGFDPHNLLLGSIPLSEGGKYVELVPGGDMQKASPLISSFYTRLLDRLAAVPGVQSAASMSAGFRDSSFAILSRPAPAPEHRPESVYGEVSPFLFRTLKIPLKRGRYINATDGPNAPWVVVINETLAHRYFPNQNPIGQRLLMRFESYHVDETRPREIVGVVGDTKLDGLDRKSFPTVYSSYLQQADVFPGGAMLAHLQQFVFLRTAPGLLNRHSNLPAVFRKAVAEIDPDQPVTDIMTGEKFLAGSMEDTQFIKQLLEIFAALALLLAAIGIYGVMSYFVSERVHEIGIRVALGAKRVDVLALITGLGLKLTLLGVFLGAVLALALTRVIVRFLVDVSPTDPLTFLLVAALLLAIALLACYLPARRAMRVDPMVVLRHE